MKSKMEDLNDRLFEQFKALNDCDLDGENLAKEIKRSDAMCKIAGQIINSNRLALDLQKALVDGAADKTQLPLLAG